MSIVLFLSGVYYSAHADVQTDSAYIQLMSVKSTTSTDLKETVGSLTHLGYNLCTLKEGLWTKVFARPYEPLHLAQSNLKDLQQQYADAFISNPLTCSPFKSADIKQTTTATFPKLELEMEVEMEPKPFSLTLYSGMNLRQGLDHLAQLKGYDRVILEVDEHRKILFSQAIENALSLSSESLDGLAKELSFAFKDSKLNINLYEILTTQSNTLLVTEKLHPRPLDIKIFDVGVGSILSNANQLARSAHWRVPSNGWQLPTDYQVKYAYPIIYVSLISAMEKLFSRYPVQAQLLQSTKQVIFAPRLLPINK